MKFNKSAESDFWYVENANGLCIGKIIFITDEDFGEYVLEAIDGYFWDHELDQISAKIKELNRESGIDTTSTFTSNEDR